MNGGSGSLRVKKKMEPKNGGKNKEAEVRYGVAHVKKGRKSKGRLRWMDILLISLNDII